MWCCGVPTAWRAPRSPPARHCRPRPCLGFAARFSLAAAPGRPPRPRAGPPIAPAPPKHKNRQGGLVWTPPPEARPAAGPHRWGPRHTAADFLAFMEKVVRAYPGRELHVILDNSSSHRTPAVRGWLAAHPQVHFHYTPTSASWLNQVEGFFGILGKQSLGVTDFHSKNALRDHLNAYMRAWRKNPTPFAWTKPAQAIIRSHRRMLERISTAVH